MITPEGLKSLLKEIASSAYEDSYVLKRDVNDTPVYKTLHETLQDYQENKQITLAQKFAVPATREKKFIAALENILSTVGVSQLAAMKNIGRRSVYAAAKSKKYNDVFVVLSPGEIDRADCANVLQPFETRRIGRKTKNGNIKVEVMPKVAMLANEIDMLELGEDDKERIKAASYKAYLGSMPESYADNDLGAEHINDLVLLPGGGLATIDGEALIKLDKDSIKIREAQSIFKKNLNLADYSDVNVVNRESQKKLRSPRYKSRQRHI